MEIAISIWRVVRCLFLIPITIAIAIAIVGLPTASGTDDHSGRDFVNRTALVNSSAPTNIQRLYETIIRSENTDENAVLYGVPVSIEPLHGDRLFVLNLSFIAVNVSRAKFYFYNRRLSKLRLSTAPNNLRLVVYLLGKGGQLQRQSIKNAQYLEVSPLTSNLTKEGWTELDMTDTINRLVRPTRRERQLTLALEFEQQQPRTGKMHRIAPQRFMTRRNGPYLVFSTVSTDSSKNFYLWFEAVLKTGAFSPASIAEDREDEQDKDEEEAIDAVSMKNATVESGDETGQADWPQTGLFDTPRLLGNEQTCSVRPWSISVPNVLRKFIIHPKTLEINRCSGSCLPGVGPEDYRNSLISRTVDKKLSGNSRLRKCCVPDKLGPIEMVFLSAKNSQYVVSRMSIPNIVAESCKCSYTYI